MASYLPPGYPGAPSPAPAAPSAPAPPTSGPQGVWGLQQPLQGIMGNPLLMAGIYGLASHFSGQPSAPGMAQGMQFAMATQQAQQMAAQNAWARRLQEMQLLKLQQDEQRRAAQEAGVRRLLGSKEVQGRLGLTGDLGPLPPKVAENLLSTALASPKTDPEIARYQFARSQGYPGSFLDFQSEGQADPQITRYQFARSQGYTGSFTEFLQEGKAPLVQVGQMGAVQPTIRTAEDLGITGGDPGDQYLVNPKTGDVKPIKRGVSGETAARSGLIKSALQDLDLAEAYFFPGGEYSQGARVASLPGVSKAVEWITGEGTPEAARDALERAIAARLRIETGAAQTAEELKLAVKTLMPGVLTGDEAAAARIANLRTMFEGTGEALGMRLVDDLPADVRTRLYAAEKDPDWSPEQSLTPEEWAELEQLRAAEGAP